MKTEFEVIEVGGTKKMKNKEIIEEEHKIDLLSGNEKLVWDEEKQAMIMIHPEEDLK